MEKEKKLYKKPELVTYGDVASISKDVIMPGTGDYLASLVDVPDVLAIS